MNAETMLWIFIGVCSVLCVVELIAMRERQNHIKALENYLAATQAHDHAMELHRAWITSFYEDAAFGRRESPTRLQ